MKLRRRKFNKATDNSIIRNSLRGYLTLNKGNNVKPTTQRSHGRCKKQKKSKTLNRTMSLC